MKTLGSRMSTRAVLFGGIPPPQTKGSVPESSPSMKYTHVCGVLRQSIREREKRTQRRKLSGHEDEEEPQSEEPPREVGKEIEEDPGTEEAVDPE